MELNKIENVSEFIKFINIFYNNWKVEKFVLTNTQKQEIIIFANFLKNLRNTTQNQVDYINYFIDFINNEISTVNPKALF